MSIAPAVTVLEVTTHITGALSGWLLHQADLVVHKFHPSGLWTSIDHGKRQLKSAQAVTDLLASGAVRVLITDLSFAELTALHLGPTAVAAAHPSLLFIHLVPSVDSPHLHWEAVAPACGQEHDAYLGRFMRAPFEIGPALTSAQAAIYALASLLPSANIKSTGYVQISGEDALLQATAVVSTRHEQVDKYLAGQSQSACHEAFVAYFRLFVDCWACADGRYVELVVLSPVAVERALAILGVQCGPLGAAYSPAQFADLKSKLEEAFLKHPSRHWEDTFQRANIAAITVRNSSELGADGVYPGVALHSPERGPARLINVLPLAAAASDEKPSSASLEEPLPEEVLRILLSAGHHNRPGPLAGMLVVDLSHTVAGPFCGRLLGEYGATVIKIDPIGVNYMFRAEDLLRGKLSIKVNLKSTEGKRLLERLLQRADVFIESFRPDVLASLDFGPERLSQINPRLIWASIKFHDSGVLQDYCGYAPLAMAVSGMATTYSRLNGLAYPVVHYMQSVDVICGQFGCVGVLAALLQRARDGLGRRLTSSLLRACAVTCALDYYPDLGAYHPPSDLVVCGKRAFVLIGPHALELKDQLNGADAALVAQEAARAVSRGDLIAAQEVQLFHMAIWAPAALACNSRMVSLNENVGGLPSPLNRQQTLPPPLAPVPGMHTASVLRTLGYSLAQIAELQENKAIKLSDRHALHMFFPQ